MSEAVIVAIISGGLALCGTVLTCLFTSRKAEQNMAISQARTEEKIENLTREVREHNNFARRMPVVEEQIKVINHRLSDLEDDKKG